MAFFCGRYRYEMLAMQVSDCRNLVFFSSFFGGEFLMKRSKSIFTLGGLFLVAEPRSETLKSSDRFRSTNLSK